MTRRPVTDPHHLDVEVVVAGGWQRRTTLREGTAVLLRQIRPQDRDRLAAGLRELSPESRELRFHTDLRELTEEQLAYLTEVDHVDHEAIVAIDLDRPGHPGVGVARFIRDPFARGVAEVTITVADRYQGRGAATLLLGALAARAREEGIEVLRHDVLARNQAMLAVLDRLGATREQLADGRWRVELGVPHRAGDLPDSPAGRAFLAAGRPRSRFAGLRRPARRRATRRPGSRSPDPLGTRSAPEQADGELTQWLADRDQRAPAWPDGGHERSARR